MKILQVLAVATCLSLAGCAGSRYSKEQVEGSIRTTLTERLNKQGKGITVTEVAMVQENENSWKGYAKFSDGTTLKATTTVDQNTGEDITTFN